MELKEGMRVFVDTAPIIYFVEDNQEFTGLMDDIFTKAMEGKIEIITSIITFIEVLTLPYKLGRNNTIKAYEDLFYNSSHFYVVDLNREIAVLTAKIRAEYNFKIPDAVQLAICELMGCELFYTNDIQLKRFNSKKVVVLSEVAIRTE